MMLLASRNVVACLVAFPRPLWAGAGGGVRTRSAPENQTRGIADHPILARLPAPDPAPNPRPQGAGEWSAAACNQASRLPRGRRALQTSGSGARRFCAILDGNGGTHAQDTRDDGR